jgi:hypothetical protein
MDTPGNGHGYNDMNLLGDLHSIITADGKEFHVPDEDNRFLFYAGYGAPPIEYLTRRSYKQHGATKVDYLLSPRAVTVQLWKKAACSRLAYWQNRAALHDLLRPNRGGSFQFVLTIPGGTKRAIYLDANPGATFTNEVDNNWDIDETLEFIAYDPVWFDPTVVTYIASTTASADLVFPITFNTTRITFGIAGLQFDTAITYDGTWVTYPTITLTGPYSSASVMNLTTGIRLTLNVAIAAGESRIITLNPQSLSVVDGTGADKFSDLGELTNLVDFNIRPDPEVAGGIQTIQTIFLGSSAGVTTVQIAYNKRYFAI